MGEEVNEGQRDGVNPPQHAAEGGLGAADEVAVAGDHQLALFLVVIWNVGSLPAGSTR